MEKKFNAITIILLILLLIRAVSTGTLLIFNFTIINILIEAAYVVATIGVFQKRQFGAILAIVIGALETIVTVLYLSIFSMAYDIAITVFAIFELLQVIEYRRALVQEPLYYRPPVQAPLQSVPSPQQQTIPREGVLYCHNCGSRVQGNFCPNCGIKIEK